MFGERIAEQRKKLGLSQEELAEKLNISQKSISKYERGSRRPSYEVLVSMAALFGVTTDYLLGVDGGEKNMKNRLKELREENGMKQSELGKLLNVQDAAISKYESGDIPLTGEKIIQLAEYFGVTTDYLLGLEGRDSMEIKEKSNEIVHRIGQNIKNLRERKGMTQKELAAALGITRSALSTYEVGIREPNHATTIAIAKLFNVTLDELVMKELTPPIPMYAQNLAYLRRKHDMTQADVANLLGVSKATSCKYENGDVEPNVEQLIKLADFFGVTMDQIIKQDLSQEVSEWKQ